MAGWKLMEDVIVLYTDFWRKDGALPSCLLRRGFSAGLPN